MSTPPPVATAPEARSRPAHAAPAADPPGPCLAQDNAPPPIELARHSPFGIYVVDADFRLCYLNEFARDGAFKNVRPVLGRDFAEAIRIIWPEPVAREIVAIFRRTLETGEPYHSAEFMNPRGDIDAVEAYEWELHRIELADGQPGVVCYYFNSTLLRRAQEALRKSEQRLELLSNTVPALISYVDRERRYVTCNDAYEKWFGMPREQIIGRRMVDVVGEKAWQVIGPWIERAFAGEAVEYEVEAPYQRGPKRWIHAAYTPHRDLSGAVIGVIVMVTDITASKQAQEALQKSVEAERAARAEAERANRAKDQFLAVLSHELRTPLSPVLMSVSAMELDPQLPASLREEMTMVRRNVELEARLIDDLLDLSRIVSGKLRLTPHPINLNALVNQVCDIVGPEIEEKGIRLTCDSSAEHLTVMADQARLQQVLWNLLNNAAKFTPRGGNIRVATWADGSERVCVEVNDSGIGIEPEVLGRIFDAFEQGEMRLTRQFGGLGLGLAICKRLVEMHGGAISVTSGGPGQGASFVVELPAAQGASPDETVGELRGPGEQTGMRILLVEDHKPTADVLARLLSRWGHSVQTAASIAEALAQPAETGFDILISDIGLPDGSGTELVRVLKQRMNLRAIALSGYGMEDDLRKSRDAGFDEHIVKPPNVAQLQLAISRLTGAGRSG